MCFLIVVFTFRLHWDDRLKNIFLRALATKATAFSQSPDNFLQVRIFYERIFTNEAHRITKISSDVKLQFQVCWHTLKHINKPIGFFLVFHSVVCSWFHFKTQSPSCEEVSGSETGSVSSVKCSRIASSKHRQIQDGGLLNKENES